MSKRRKKTINRSWESPSVSVTNPGISEILANNPSSSGVEINKHSVFALPAFYRGVDLIASTIARMPCNTFKHSRGEYGGKEKDTDHAAYKILVRRPNRWNTPFELKREMISNAIWAGNSYTVVMRDEQTAEPTDLILLDPTRTYPVVLRSTTDVSDIKIYYITTINGRNITIDYDDMIHLKSIGHEQGCMGLRLLDVAKEVLGLGIAEIKWSSIYYRHSGQPSMCIEFPSWMNNKEQVEQFREGLAVKHIGLTNAHKVMILQNGAKWVNVNPTNADAQLIESRQMSLIDIANLLGLPPSKLGANVNTSYKSLEEETLSLLNFTIDKWAVNLEEQFERCLLTEVEKQRGSRFIEFDRSKLLLADHQTTINNMVSLVNNGLITPNYACVELNLPTLGDDGDKLRLPNGVTLLNDDDEAIDPNNMIDPAPPEEQEGTPDAPTADDDDSPNEKLRSLTRSVLQRFKVRLEKAADQASKKPDWKEWVATGLEDDHGEILRETLQPLMKHPESFVNGLFADLREELSEVTRDKIHAVFDRMDLEKWLSLVLA